MVMLKKIVILSAVVFVIMGFAANSILAAEAGKININNATVEELMKLEKVGSKYAQRIIEYREKNGPFKLPEDIMKVKGIGVKVWEANKDKIVIK